MKVIGIIGGMSAESTVPYYEMINRELNRRLGGNHGAEIVLPFMLWQRLILC